MAVVASPPLMPDSSRQSLTIQVAAGLICQRGRYLIAKRKPGTHLGGLWEFPGGKREGGESMEECLRRELREELGIEVAGPKLFRVIRHEYPEKTVELHFFLCDAFSGTPEPHGCDALAWVAPGDLNRYDFPPADRPIVESLNPEAYGK